MRFAKAVIIAVLAFHADARADTNYDFFFKERTCKAIAASTENWESGVKAMDADESSYLWACRKQRKQQVSCLVKPVDKKQQTKSNTRTLEATIVLDTPAAFTLESANNSEILWVNRQTSIGVSTSRLLDSTYSVAKVCQGVFVTAAEAKSSSAERTQPVE